MFQRGSADARRPERGFTFVEMMIVVFIVGVIAVISTIAVSQALKKARLNQMAESVRGLVGRARIYAAQNQAPVFVFLGPTGTAMPKRLFVIVDRNRNGIPDNTENVEPPVSENLIEVGANSGNVDMCFSSTSVSGLQTNWPAWPGGRFNPYRCIVCDPMGRTIDPNTGSMTQAVLTMSLSHREMVLAPGRLSKQIWTVSVTPLFSVRVNRTR